MATRQVATFEAGCADCEAVFAAPHLGDFVYGEFLLFGDKGTAHAILTEFGNPVWRLAESLGCTNVPRAVAAVADAVDGQKLGVEHICPQCYSRNWSYWEGKRIAMTTVTDATFVAFRCLSDDEKAQALLNG